MIDKVKKKLSELMQEGDDSNKEKKIVIIDPDSLGVGEPPKEPDLRTIGLFGDVSEEKVACFNLRWKR